MSRGIREILESIGNAAQVRRLEYHAQGSVPVCQLLLPSSECRGWLKSTLCWQKSLGFVYRVIGMRRRGIRPKIGWAAWSQESPRSTHERWSIERCNEDAIRRSPCRSRITSGENFHVNCDCSVHALPDQEKSSIIFRSPFPASHITSTACHPPRLIPPQLQQWREMNTLLTPWAPPRPMEALLTVLPALSQRAIKTTLI